MAAPQGRKTSRKDNNSVWKVLLAWAASVRGLPAAGRVTHLYERQEDVPVAVEFGDGGL